METLGVTRARVPLPVLRGRRRVQAHEQLARSSSLGVVGATARLGPLNPNTCFASVTFIAPSRVHLASASACTPNSPVAPDANRCVLASRVLYFCASRFAPVNRNPLCRLRLTSGIQAAPFFFSSSRITRRSFFSSGSLRSCVYSRKALLIIVW